jgi:hypothetical protein
MGIGACLADLVLKGAKVRHNPAAIAQVAVNLAVAGRKRREIGSSTPS